MDLQQGINAIASLGIPRPRPGNPWNPYRVTCAQCCSVLARAVPRTESMPSFACQSQLAISEGHAAQPDVAVTVAIAKRSRHAVHQEQQSHRDGAVVRQLSQPSKRREAQGKLASPVDVRQCRRLFCFCGRASYHDGMLGRTKLIPREG